MRRILFISAASLLMIQMMSITALAHGGHGHGHGNGNGNSNRSQTYTQQHYIVCPTEDCTETGLHEHDGTYYYCRNHSTHDHTYNHCGRSLNR